MFLFFIFFFFKQKTAYEITEGDWSSDVCSSDLEGERGRTAAVHPGPQRRAAHWPRRDDRLRGGDRRGVEGREGERGRAVDVARRTQPEQRESPGRGDRTERPGGQDRRGRRLRPPVRFELG